MRPDLFESLAPVCPRCLHLGGAPHALKIGAVIETRGGRVWHGVLHCSNPDCWLEYPVIDGIPVVTPDPAATLSAARGALLARLDLPAAIDGLIGDAAGPGSDFDTQRQHLSLYAGDHFGDWAGTGHAPCAVATLDSGLAALGALPPGPAIDLGGATGRAGWEIAHRTGRTTVVADLNLSFLRFAQRLRTEGRAPLALRRIGLVYDVAEVVVPADRMDDPVEFWALDILALPFRADSFAMAALINVVDCVPGPTELVTETARVLAPGAGAVVSTPYDWSAVGAPPAGWFGGHSQRAAHRGAGEPVLSATLDRAGLKPLAEQVRLPWTLRLHDRAEMHYSLHMVACKKSI